MFEIPFPLKDRRSVFRDYFLNNARTPFQILVPVHKSSLLVNGEAVSKIFIFFEKLRKYRASKVQNP